MVQTATNKGKYLIVAGSIVPGTTDLRMGLLKTLASHGGVPDVNFVADMEAHASFAELTGAAGYARVPLTTVTVTEDDGNAWALLDCDTVAFGVLGAGGTIVGCFLYVHTGSDATAPVVGIYGLTSFATNGTTFNVTTASGIAILA